MPLSKSKNNKKIVKIVWKGQKYKVILLKFTPVYFFYMDTVCSACDFLHVCPCMAWHCPGFLIESFFTRKCWHKPTHLEKKPCIWSCVIRIIRQTIHPVCVWNGSQMLRQLKCCMREREHSNQMSYQKLPYFQWFVRLNIEKTISLKITKKLKIRA